MFDCNNNDNLNDNNNNIKQITIVPSQKEVKEQTKKIKCNKEKKLKVETKTWGLIDEDLTHDKQLTNIKDITNKRNLDKYKSKLASHIKLKICGYKQQDIIKKKINEQEFVSFEETIDLLQKCEMTCYYCSENVYVLYEHVREMKQWSLDRINNDIGHNNGNLVIACLECNLKRRRTNKDAFLFTKNMVIIKED